MFTTMGTIGFCLCFILFVQVNQITGQFLPQEELLNLTTCTLNSVNLNCVSDDMIAFQSAHFYYHPTCESTCCQHSSDHDTVRASEGDITDIRRQCSGESSCTLNIEGVRTFDSGGKLPSYAILSYYCIPKSRTATICSADSLSSGGSLLYLTNEGFPTVTLDHRSCSCSLEVYSCASGFNMYLVDADMYLDEVNCQQRIDIFDGKNASLMEIKCASYYKNEIDTSTFNTNYIRFDFTDNSSSNQEGIFFVGFGATEPNVTFKLSCAAEPQTTCIDCGELYTIPNGNLTAAVDGSTSFGAKASVACDQGYQVSGYCNRSTEFQCGDGTCIIRNNRCNTFPDCPDQLDELLCQNMISCPEGQKLCDVTCVNEQETCEDSESSVAGMEAGTISCLVIGKWEKVKCSAKDCGTPTDIENGIITLTEDCQTTYMSTADVTCDTGFTPSIALISCQADGSWENGTCNIIDGETSETETGDGTINCLVKGKWEKVQCSPKDTAQKETGDSSTSTLPVIILACSLTAVVSVALTLIVMFIVRKYKSAKPNTLTSPPEHVVYYNTGVRENLDNSEGDNHQYEHLNETNASEATYSALDVDISTNQRTSIDCLR